MRFRLVRGSLILPLAVLAAAGGCDGPPVVEGEITWDGRAVENGTILFTSAGPGHFQEGCLIRDGRYRTSLPSGPVKVEIRAVKVVGKTKGIINGEEVEIDATEPLLPKEYNDETTLRAEIQSGTNRLDFRLPNR
jgi:hypothetical protein